MDSKQLKQKLLNGNKTDRIIFAVTPELKEALAIVAKDQCTNVSALLTSLAVEEVNKNCEVLEQEGVSW